MELRISRAMAALALLTCVACPVLEMFDRWDHTLQTGQDTEYSLVLLALCLGVAYVLARLILKFSVSEVCEKPIANLRLHESLPSFESMCRLAVPVDGSPPRALRI